MNEELKLNRPDVSFANRIKAIFGDDPEIEMSYECIESTSDSKLTINVHNMEKAAALNHVLAKTYEFGKLTLHVEINDTTDYINGDIIQAIFTGNPHFKEYKEIYVPITETYLPVCIFNKEVIQFANDNGGSLHGYEFRLMEDLAREVLPIPKLFYTTDDGIDEK